MRAGGKGGSRAGGSDSASGGTGGSDSDGGGAGGTDQDSGGSGGDQGGTGGAIAGGSGGGAGGSAMGGMGGSGPVFDFETNTQFWNDGVTHLGMDQCTHKRIAAGEPMMSAAQNVSGASAIAYPVDVAAARASYTIGLRQAGSTNNGPPAGAKVVYNVWIPGSEAPGALIQGFVLGSGVPWRSVDGVAATDQWYTMTLEIAGTPVMFPPFGFRELGVLISGPPDDFKETIYVDAVDVIIPGAVGP